MARHWPPVGSGKLAEFFDGDTSIAHDSTHRVGVHGIVAWNRQDADSVGHHDVFTLAHEPKDGFLKDADGILGLTPGSFGTPTKRRQLPEQPSP
jgi:hypothetical protein